MNPVLKRFDLSGRIALVTGSSAGIGLAIASGLAGAGATVVLNARGGDKLARAAAALKEGGATVHEAVFDVTSGEAVAAAVERIEREVGAIDILVNNAGRMRSTSAGSGSPCSRAVPGPSCCGPTAGSAMRLPKA